MSASREAIESRKRAEKVAARLLATIPKKKRSPPRLCETPGCGHRAMHHATSADLTREQFEARAFFCKFTYPKESTRAGERCKCQALELPPKKKRDALKPWERKIVFRPLGVVTRPWPRRVREDGSKAKPGVFVIFDLVREKVVAVGAHAHNVAREALRKVRGGDDVYEFLVQDEKLLSRGAAAVWFCLEVDPKVREEAVAKLRARFSVKKEER